MTIPGFTAEISLYTMSKNDRISRNYTALINGSGVMLAMNCDAYGNCVGTGIKECNDMQDMYNATGGTSCPGGFTPWTQTCNCCLCTRQIQH